MHMDQKRYVFLICASVVVLVYIYSHAASTTVEEGRHWSTWSYNDLTGVHPIGIRGTNLLWQTKQDEASPVDVVVRPRADAWCSATVNASLIGLAHAEALFDCRAGVARRQAEAACERLLEHPPDPPFSQATLNLRRYTAGHTPARRPGSDPPDDAPLATPPDSITLAVEGGSDIVSDSIKRKGTWEISEVDAVLTALERAAPTAGPAPPVLVDVGANLGVFTVAAAALGYPVIAFEALERNVAAIHQTLCWNPGLHERVTLFPYGLGDAERDCAVLSDDGNIGDGHLVCSEAEARPYQRSMAPRAPAHSVRLGEYLAGAQADVMKLDVEGYELHVIDGDVLDRVQFALSEVSAEMAKKSGGSFHAAVRTYLRAWTQHGFDIHFCEPGFGCLLRGPWDAEAAAQQAEELGLSNVLFVRRRAAEAG